MSKFTLEIDTNGAAFRDPEGNLDGDEIARILTELANDFYNGPGLGTDGSLRDFNGNAVGRYQYTDEDSAAIQPGARVYGKAGVFHPYKAAIGTVRNMLDGGPKDGALAHVRLDDGKLAVVPASTLVPMEG